MALRSINCATAIHDDDDDDDNDDDDNNDGDSIQFNSIQFNLYFAYKQQDKQAHIMLFTSSPLKKFS
jgi:hypothetical protein